MSSARVTMKTPLVRKATGNLLKRSTILGKLRALSLASVALEIRHATQLDCMYKAHRTVAPLIPSLGETRDGGQSVIEGFGLSKWLPVTLLTDYIHFVNLL